MSLFPCNKPAPSTDAERRLWEARRLLDVSATQGDRLRRLLDFLETDEAKEAAEDLGLDLDGLTKSAKAVSESTLFANPSKTAATPKHQRRSPRQSGRPAEAATTEDE